MKMSIREATLNLHPDSYREPCKPVLSGDENPPIANVLLWAGFIV